MKRQIQIVFREQPSPSDFRFLHLDVDGKRSSRGEWTDRGDGTHQLAIEIDECPCAADHNPVSLRRQIRLANAILAGSAAGLFSVFGHPDLGLAAMVVVTAPLLIIDLLTLRRK